MRNVKTKKYNSTSLLFLNPEKLWAIENELINIPFQYRDKYWNEILASYTHDTINE